MDKLHLLTSLTMSLFQVGIVINTITEHYIFGWRVTLSVQILVGSVLALGALFLYETPR